jgi:predicted permease
MIVVGATLAGISIKGLFSRTEVWIGSLMRLLIMPMIIFFIMRIFKENDASARVANFLVAMPAAAQTVIFAERYDADVSLASGIVFISTVFSAITIPLAAKIISA